MNDECYKRYKKCNEIDCLYSIRKDSKYHFLISGSANSKYSVTVSDKTITCSCPDYKHNSKDLEIVCKHCIYVLTKVLKLFPVEHSFWKRRFFTPDEYKSIKNSYKVNKVKDKKDIKQ
jgi:hypothetical protein